MKYNFFSFSLFFTLSFSSFLLAQNDYKFDTFSKIVSIYSSGEYERTYLINSSNDSYFMEIYTQNDSTYSRIYDCENTVSHYFYFDKLDSLKLIFIKSIKFKKYDKSKIKKKKYEFSEIMEENGLIRGVFKVSNTKGRKLAKFKITYKKTEKNYFSLFSFFVLESRYSKIIQTPHNLLLLEAKGRNESGNFVYYKLKEIHDINLFVKINQQQE